MKSTKTTEIVITMNENEAKWLKNLVQNPIGSTPDDEPKDDKTIRRSFWDTLRKEGV